MGLFQSVHGSYPYVAHLYHKQTNSVIYVWIILHGFQDLNSRIIELVNDKREWISNEAIVANSKVGRRSSERIHENRGKPK